MKRAGKREFTDRERRAFVAMYGDDSYTVADIGQRFGIRAERVADYARRFGLKLRGAGMRAGWPTEEAR